MVFPAGVRWSVGDPRRDGRPSAGVEQSGAPAAFRSASSPGSPGVKLWAMPMRPTMQPDLLGELLQVRLGEAAGLLKKMIYAWTRDGVEG